LMMNDIFKNIRISCSRKFFHIVDITPTEVYITFPLGQS
jgi:hypothetical protein